MNEFLKQQILNVIANGHIISTSRLGARSYVVYQNGKRLMSVNNDWDYGAHNLIINDQVVLLADKNSADRRRPINAIINEIIDICNACEKRYREQLNEQENAKKLEAAKRTMSAKEAELSNFLNSAKKQYTI